MADQKARDIMSSDCSCIGENDSALDAAKRLAELDVGAMPICGEDDRLKGMITDRDIVVKVLAQGKDPASVRASELGAGDGETVTIGADDPVSEAVRTMIDKKVRRLPVIDEHRLVGIVSQADIARNADEEMVGDLELVASARGGRTRGVWRLVHDMHAQLAEPPDRAVATLACKQHGVVARRQLQALGLGRGAVANRLATGRLHALYRGVYAVGHTRLSGHGRWMATVLACGPGA